MLLAGGGRLAQAASRWRADGVGTGLISLGSHVYLPRALNSAARQYGALGIAFTYISWLFVVMAVLVAPRWWAR